MQGRAVAAALRQCTHLTALSLGAQNWDDPVRDAIAAAWRGPPGGLRVD